MTELEKAIDAWERIEKILKEKNIHKGDIIKINCDTDKPENIGTFLKHGDRPEIHSKNPMITIDSSRHPGSKINISDDIVLGIYKITREEA